MWSVLICTPVMRRVHNEPLAQETLFVDSTSHLDVTNCTFTALATSTKAGAIPIGILLHGQQSKDNYLQAFSLLNDNYPKAFGGKHVNSIFCFNNFLFILYNYTCAFYRLRCRLWQTTVVPRDQLLKVSGLKQTCSFVSSIGWPRSGNGWCPTATRTIGKDIWSSTTR